MDRNMRLFYQAAQQLGLMVKYHADIAYLSIILGKKNYYFHRTITPLNKGASIFIAKNKYKLNKILEASGFPVPKAVAFTANDYEEQSLSDLIQGLRFPLVAKPMTDSGRGTEVLCNIKNINTLSDHIERMIQNHSCIQVEEFHQHFKEYRILVLKKRVIGVVERFGASVIGDGKHSIEELIAKSNEQRAQLSLTLTISPLIVDEEYMDCLAEQNLTLQSIPDLGEKIRLCYTVNTGRGGEIYSHGKQIHPLNVEYLCRAAKTIGLTYVGLDVICEDINLPFNQTNWVIIEANFNPDLTIHEIPNRGKKAKVINKLLLQLIYRHPFSYVYHLCMHSRWSIYIKMIFCSI